MILQSGTGHGLWAVSSKSTLSGKRSTYYGWSQVQEAAPTASNASGFTPTSWTPLECCMCLASRLGNLILGKWVVHGHLQFFFWAICSIPGMPCEGFICYNQNLLIVEEDNPKDMRACYLRFWRPSAWPAVFFGKVGSPGSWRPGAGKLSGSVKDWASAAFNMLCHWVRRGYFVMRTCLLCLLR